MSTWYDEIFNTTGTSTTEALLNAGQSASTGAYTPSKAGTLVTVIVQPSFTAATSVIYSGYIRLQSAQFGGTDIVVAFCEGGIATAPAFPPQPTVWPVNVPAAVGVPINGKYAYNTAPTTPRLDVYGQFQG